LYRGCMVFQTARNTGTKTSDTKHDKTLPPLSSQERSEVRQTSAAPTISGEKALKVFRDHIKGNFGTATTYDVKVNGTTYKVSLWANEEGHPEFGMSINGARGTDYNFKVGKNGREYLEYAGPKSKHALATQILLALDKLPRK
jgi:hypothetical protein